MIVMNEPITIIVGCVNAAASGEIWGSKSLPKTPTLKIT